MFKPMTKKETKEFVISRAGTPEHFYLLRDLEASKRNNIPFIQDISIELFKLLLDKRIYVRISDASVNINLTGIQSIETMHQSYDSTGLGIPFKSEKDYATRETIFCYNTNEVFKSMKGLFSILLDAIELSWLGIAPLHAPINAYERQRKINNYGEKNARTLSIEWLLRDNIVQYLSTPSRTVSFIEMFFINNLIKELEPLIEYLEFLEQNGIEKHDDNAIELYELNKIM